MDNKSFADFYRRIPLLVKVLVAILLGISLGMVVPGFFVKTMNTLCGIFSQLLGFMIPLIIVGLVTPAIARIGRGAGRMLLVTALLAYGFTVFSGLFAYSFSATLFPHLLESASLSVLNNDSGSFEPYFSIQIPPIMPVMTALVVSFMMGLGIAAFDADKLKSIFGEFEQIVTLTIAKVIVPMLPPFIFGLFLDMAACGKVGPVLAAFVKIIVVIFTMTLVLLILQYIVAGTVTHRNPFKLLRTMLPAYFTALGTSSSAATIPVTLRQTKNNGVRDEIASFVVPLCATIHLSGSTLKITSCAIALMMMNGMSVEFPQLLGFVLLLGVTMIAAPGVPGGAIMAALGILESVLGFDDSLQAMMITLYIAMDSFGTACNVTGDGAIALIINNISEKRNYKLNQQKAS
ncbi:MAG: dicarboxylate/amino acid:cation symporter [Bacteroidales bacterium]|nr:dicarboxylate/amino acid:cation symporter [Bacteroidales bacterium]